MQIGRLATGVALSVLTLAATPVWALGPITVPNHSFELPVVNNPFNATAELSSWQKSPIPQYVEASGTFKNVDTAADVDTDPDIDNMDGVQGAFFFSAPFNEIYQELTATFTVGDSYQLLVNAEGGGLGMLLGEPLVMNLYHVVAGNRVPIYSAIITNNNPPNTPITHLDQYALYTPVVQAGDAWVGKQIGIQFFAPETATGGYWDLDNVRLDVVPEPASIGLIALAGMASLRRRR